ncbi:hypothetical protein PspLS_08306 [Pyricularia sp. CBS 133598]|nr:hypothetical protein PspLS_08306 [Pyricularia sp. CBS 133598]
MFPQRDTSPISILFVWISAAFNLAQCQQSRGTPSNPSNPFNCSECSGTNATLALSLDKKWKNDNIILDTLNRGGLLPRDGVDTNARGAALWASEGTPGDAQSYKIFNWGGQARYRDDDARHPAPPPLIRLTPSRVGTIPATTEGGWAVVATPLNGPEGILRTNKGAWTTCNGVGYLLGGVKPYGMGDDAIPGLVTLDLERTRFLNRTGPDFGSGRQPSLPGTYRNGAAVCLPRLGTDGRGIVVFLGGEYARAIRTWGPVQMDRVYMYDIATERFYMQRTTGGGVDGTPKVRSGLCAVAAGSGSGGKYEVVVFGGSERSGVPSDVHVLTIPGFRWFKVPNTDRDNKPREYHQCAVVGDGKRQMLSLGGSVQGPDPWPNAIKVLDMTELKWEDEFDPELAEYQAPSMVTDWYSNGGLQNVSWENEDTRKLFAQAMVEDNTTSTTRPPAEIPASRQATPQASVAMIAGGVAGGVVLLVLLAILSLLIFRRRRRPVEQEPKDSTRRSSASDLHDKAMLDSAQIHEMSDRPTEHELQYEGSAVHEMLSERRPGEIPGLDVPIELSDREPAAQEMPASPVKEKAIATR